MLSLVKNPESKKVEVKTKKVNNIFKNIQPENITELSHLIYVRAKLVSDKIISLENASRYTKARWEMRLESKELKKENIQWHNKKKRPKKTTTDKNNNITEKIN